MRLIFIPGFGEGPTIFEHIAPSLPGNKLFINNLDLLGVDYSPTRTVTQYAEQLIEHHNINRQDVLIGHSMGGWVAYAIKQLTGCAIVQIASWTDPEKVRSPVKDLVVLEWLVRKNLYLNGTTKKLILWLGYRDKPSAQVMNDVFQNLINSPKGYIMNQLGIILNPANPQTPAQPDLRIHARNDSIVGFPDQQTQFVPGDHFSLVTHPGDVSALLNDFLKAAYTNE
ncbi:alpha/beta fold hydrolase [Spirosoma fluviale]|uniref:Pimeloyl-ACP methyl ester carboxylesterase n=1 Tax=Spirosoma fluviale TaxID=1597977 RepID=A0A286GPJ2_9BACT|nr:alpha/beta hydrolase [Spirosoma fluviale]SOD97422.1 Pimeloyl-ACP methyl ester carboxylesterase [Spirosoma fluviale]